VSLPTEQSTSGPVLEETQVSTPYPRCICCGASLSDPSARCGLWCMVCHDRALGELLAMGDLSSDSRFIVVGLLHAVGAETCARVVTRVPFEGD
jgi:hypothetical protein